MLKDNKIWVAQGENPCYLLLNQANRHGLIAGATGTGKTVTLKVLAEGMSDAGVPVFITDVKGDVTGMAQPGQMTDGLRSRLPFFGLDEKDVAFSSCPVRVWDLFAESATSANIPTRVTVSDMGPVLLARMLGLTEVQAGVLSIVFRVADDRGLLLLDLKDLRSMLAYVSENAKDYRATYGNVSPQSVGAIQRALLALEDEGGNVFFGEPALQLGDLLACAPDGRGYVNLLAATRLVRSPRVYAMFLLWLLSSVYDTLPEVGDPDKPRLALFFDEAHLLFADIPKELGEKIVQVVRLVRSKGVGVYFITQSPADVPDNVLAQLSNRIQHGLRAYTPAEQKAVRAAAASFRTNPAFDSATALQELATGEALVSLLDEGGRPSVVERARVLFPHGTMAAASDETLAAIAASAQADGLMERYGTAIDRDSAYEALERESANAAERAALDAERAQLEKEKADLAKQKEKDAAAAAKAAQKEAERAAKAAAKEEERRAKAEERRREKNEQVLRRAAGSALGQIGREASRQLVRGLFGALKR